MKPKKINRKEAEILMRKAYTGGFAATFDPEHIQNLMFGYNLAINAFEKHLSEKKKKKNAKKRIDEIVDLKQVEYLVDVFIRDLDKIGKYIEEACGDCKNVKNLVGKKIGRSNL